MGCLYKLDFPNGKSYVGIAKDTVEKRFKAHCSPSNKFLSGNAIRKYGKENVALSTLVIADDWSYLKELERKAIAAYGTKTPNGYNMTDGGDGALGYKHTASHMAKIKGVKPKGMAGYVFTEEDRAKIAAAGKGRKHSEETRAKIGEANKRRKWSDESRAKASASHKGVVPPNKGIPMGEAQKAKVSASKKAANVTLSDTHKAAISSAMKGNKHLLGHRHSEETKAKILASCKLAAKRSVA